MLYSQETCCIRKSGSKSNIQKILIFWITLIFKIFAVSKLNSLMTIAKMSKCTKKSVNEKAFPCARTEAGQNKLKDLLKTNWIETWKQSPKKFCKKGLFKFFLRNSQENICARASNLLKFQTWSFIQKETSAQEFSYEFCEKVLRTSTL